MQGNDVLATARQAVAGVGSFFGTASRKLEAIGSSIDRKAQELIQTGSSPSDGRIVSSSGSPSSQRRKQPEQEMDASDSRAKKPWKFRAAQEKEWWEGGEGEWGWGSTEEEPAQQPRFGAS